MNTMFTLLLLASLWACPVRAQETLLVAGTGENQEVLRAVAQQFQAKHPGVTVEVPDSIGSGGGIKALKKGKTDIARIGRPLKETEKAGLVEHLFGKSAVVFATHPSVTKVDHLATAQIQEIYTGKITNWQEVGGPDAKIYPISRETGDSARIVLEAKMPGFKDLKLVSKEIFSSPEAVQTVRTNEFTIAYLSLAAAHDGGLNFLKIDGKSPILDTKGKVDYPYLIPFYLVTSETPSALAKEFIEFTLSPEGRSILLANGTLPLN